MEKVRRGMVLIETPWPPLAYYVFEWTRTTTHIHHHLRTNGLVELKFALIADLDDDGAFDRVIFLGECHLAGNAAKFFDIGQIITNAFAVFFNIAGNFAAGLNGFPHQSQRIPCRSSDVIRNISVFLVASVDESWWPLWLRRP